MNLIFGWSMITLGLLAGCLLGAGFLREDFLGGYAAPRRRLLRLGHIAMIALGAVNILFGLTAARVDPSAAAWASASLVAGAIAMPLVCGLTAWRPRLLPLFTVPVLCLLAGTAVTVWGLLP